MTSVNLLINKPILKIGRSSNMVWILFGKSVTEKNYLGKDVVKGEYSLHLQSPWRIKNATDSSIMLASGDIYEPRSDVEWNENFNWDVQDNNLFDEKVNGLFLPEIFTYVENIAILERGDLKIVFSNKLILECFVNVSTNQECWRFFRYGDKNHFVIYGGS